MLSWHLLVSSHSLSKARKAITKLSEHYKRRIVELLMIFRENPVPAEYYDIKKLKGHTNTYRARIGDMRVIYEILMEPEESPCAAN